MTGAEADDGPAGIPLPQGIRLVATDLDGTLLRADQSVGPRTRRALAALADAGIDLVLVTGRPPRWLLPVVQETGHRGTAICANGAVVVDLAEERVTLVRPLDAEIALEAVTRLRRLRPGVTFAAERAHVGDDLTVTRFGLDPDYHPAWPLPHDTERAPIEELVRAGGLVKLLARPVEGVGLAADDFLAEADEVLGPLLEVTHSGATGTLLEMSPPGVDKGSALAMIAAERGIDAAAVVAVGDMPNDLPMLRWAGTSFAVGNAHPAVLDLTTGVLAHHDDEGVADLLEALAQDLRPPRL